MRRWFLVVLAVVTVLAAVVPMAHASPADEYDGPYFGDGNLPPGCIRDMSPDNPENICHHMRTDLNALDSPQVDVAILVPVSPTAERDMRIMRQSIEMWEGGIDYLADEMGLPWLSEGVDFHITVDYVDLEGDGDGGEFTTYPIVDPEVVVIASNPVGGLGIGVDPIDFVFTDEDLVPCHGVQNPFDFEYWEALPGFDSHHEARSGTYREDCGGAGGNICFAINGAIDPAPEEIDFFNLFDLVSHEVGHCLTLGHVGDGAEGAWGVLPPNDIMAYSTEPAGLNKCVSTLDVEVFATRMSRYLDTNGDGVVDDDDLLTVNDVPGDGLNPFHVQHPDDHLYASSTGDPTDCPQPDLGLVPGERTDWTPDPVDTGAEPVLTVTGPADGSQTQDGTVTVSGTVERVAPTGPEDEITSSTAVVDDADDDATTPVTEILDVDVAVTDSHVEATMALADLWPSTDLTSATSYSLTVDGRRFDSFVRYPTLDANPMTWDAGASAYMPDGTSTWDLDAKTVTFHIERDHLAGAGIDAPYFVATQANVGLLSTVVADDLAPDGGATVGVTSARVVGTGDVPLVGAVAETITFEHPDGNTFYPEQSTLGATTVAGIDPSHHFTLDVAQRSDVTVTLDWTDAVGGSDLDLYISGAADSATDGATTAIPETVSFTDVTGTLNLRVEPYLVTDPGAGATYTLTAEVTPLADVPDDGGTDTDDDGVDDEADSCPDEPGTGADGCPVSTSEQVVVFVDDVEAASQAVETDLGSDSFAVDVSLPEGDHVLRVEWMDGEEVLASATRTVTHTTDDDGDGVTNDQDACPGHDDTVDSDGDGVPDGCDTEVDGDRDGDGVADRVDNCQHAPNADQADLDGDGQGDACDNDVDGDGHSNGKEQAQGTDPRDPDDHPGRGRTA